MEQERCKRLMQDDTEVCGLRNSLYLPDVFYVNYRQFKNSLELDCVNFENKFIDAHVNYVGYLDYSEVNKLQDYSQVGT